MEDLQNQNLVDDKALADISSEGSPAGLVPPPTAVVAATTPASVAKVKVPSVHDLGLLDKLDKEDEPVAPIPAPVVSSPISSPVAEPVIAPVVAAQAKPGAPVVIEDEELASLKSMALDELSPMLDRLDLPAEQKFEAYMEVIRASDNKDLLKPAFEAAKAIENEDRKAQALLDVVNEVNYLSQEDK